MGVWTFLSSLGENGFFSILLIAGDDSGSAKSIELPARAEIPGKRLVKSRSIAVLWFPESARAGNSSPIRLLKKAHLRRWRARAALRRTN
jgi:hypothetical protein